MDLATGSMETAVQCGGENSGSMLMHFADAKGECFKTWIENKGVGEMTRPHLMFTFQSHCHGHSNLLLLWTINKPWTIR